MNAIFHQWKSIKPLNNNFLEEFDRWSMIQEDWLEKSKYFREEDLPKFSKIEKKVNVRSFIFSGQIEDLFRFSNDLKENRGQTENIISCLVEGQQIEHRIKNLTSEQKLSLLDFDEISKRLTEHMRDYFQKDLNVWFIKGLHELAMYGIKHYEGRDSRGNITKISLEKGVWKKNINSVIRNDGQKHEYCSPEQVQSEIEKLLTLTNVYLKKVERKELNPVAVAGFLHHRFTQIHPFPDGNGRVARLLMNFVLIKFKLLPIIINPDEKDEYYKFLEKADKGNLESFIQFLRQLENGRIQNFYNSWENENSLDPNDIAKYGAAIGKHLKEKISKQQQKIEDDLYSNLDEAYKISEKIINKNLKIFSSSPDLNTLIKQQAVEKNVTPNKSHYYWSDIIGFVKSLDNSNQYFIQKSENNSSYIFRLQYSDSKKGNIVFELIISFHEVGRTNQISICPFLQIKKYSPQRTRSNNSTSIQNLKYYLKKPFFISADEKEKILKDSLMEFFNEISEKFILDIGQYLKQNI